MEREIEYGSSRQRLSTGGRALGDQLQAGLERGDDLIVIFRARAGTHAPESDDTCANVVGVLLAMLGIADEKTINTWLRAVRSPPRG